MTEAVGSRMQPHVRKSLRVANTALAMLESAGVSRGATLTPEEALRTAKRRSGITDFDCAEFYEPLQKLCETVCDSRLTPFARTIRRTEVLDRTTNRLLLERALRADPSIAAEPIERPLFIIGLPRSGTTLLHRLLAQDPMHRAPLLWETATPFPRHTDDTDDRRVRRMKLATRTLSYLAPHLMSKHELDATAPEECNLLLANGLVGGIWPGRTAEFDAWFSNLDKTPAYRVHKLQLQYLQRLRGQRQRWVLKSPDHLTNIEWLLRVYPDACVVQLHRDPLEALPSAASLLATLEAMVLWDVDLHEIGARVYRWAKQVSYHGLNTSATRARYATSGARILDIRYADLVRRPLDTVADIYAAFGFKVSAQAAECMRDYLVTNPQYKHGTHKYSLADFGLSAATIRAQCAPYVDEFVRAAPPWRGISI